MSQKSTAIYVRVSTNKQEADNQLLDLRRYCEKSGYGIHDEYLDIISGKETSRPAFDRMFRDAHKKLFDVVVFWDLSRFSRSGTLFTLQKLQELSNAGVGWESYQEPYFRSAGQFADVVISIVATIAKIEREKVSERTKAGLRRARGEGKQLGRPKVEINEAVLRESFERHGSIARAAKELGLSYTTARRLLKANQKGVSKS